jgi:hypothetical protein
MQDDLIIKVEDLITQINEALHELDAEQLCEVGDFVLNAKHVSLGVDEHGEELVEQTWNHIAILY